MVIARDSSRLSDLDFQGKDAGETFQFQFHQHWIRMLWPVAKLLLWNTVIFGIGYSIFFMTFIEDDLTRRLALSLLTLFFVLVYFEFLVRFYRYLLYVVVVTDKKVHRIKKTLITLDDHLSVDLWMMQDIEKCQNGIMQNLLRFGTIILEVQETVMRLHFVPNIASKYEQIMYLREQARAKMGYFGGEARRELEKKEPLGTKVTAI